MINLIMNVGRMDMPENKSNDSRRKLLKSIAAGSGAIVAGKSLPESWSRPVVDSVMLPAHAQTSPGCSTEYAGSYRVTGPGDVTGTITRCDDVTSDWNPPIFIDIGADCSVSVSFTGNRPLTGTGTLTGRTFSVAVSRTEDCGASAGANDATGIVSGNIDFDGDRITGDATFGGGCDCNTAPARPDFTGSVSYTAYKD